MTPNHDALMECLERVVEPCSLSMGSPMSICDMGLIEDVRFVDGAVEVVLEGPADLVAQVESFVKRGPGDSSVESVQAHDESPDGLSDFRTR